MDYRTDFSKLHKKRFNQWKTIDYSKVPVALVARLKWDTIARLLTMVVPMILHRTWSK